jgi:iron complex outermembrane recepter protein
MIVSNRPFAVTLVSAFIAAASVISGTARAAAATADPGALEEVIVTAQNRVENVQKVPIAIDVVSAEKIAETGFASLNDIQKVAPAVQIINDNNAMRVTVRGVGSNTNGETDDTSVVLNVDGEYINRGNVLSTSMFDIERIEVLRGPQGTLYGRNSTGGALNIITRKPGDKLAFNGSIGRGNYSANKIEGGVDFPLSSIAAVRIAGIYSDHDGYFSHPANAGPVLVSTPAAKSGIDRNSGGRVSLRLDPTDKLTVNAALEYSKHFYVNPSADTVDLNSPGNAPTGPGCNAPGFVNIAPLWEAIPAGYINPDDPTNVVNPYSACVPANTNFLASKDRKAAYVQPWYGVGGYNQDSRAARAHVSYKFGPAATLTYVGGYRDSGQTGDQGLPVIYHTITFQNDVKTQSHELRLNGKAGNVTYQGGLFHFDEKLLVDSGFAIDEVAFGLGPPGAGQSFLSYFTRDQDSKSDSAFGQIDWGMTNALTAQLGLRYTKNKRSAVYGNAPFPLPFSPIVPTRGIARVNLDTVFGPIPHSFSKDTEESKTTYLAGLNYSPNARTLVYGKVSTGFKAGGFDQVGQFNPETNTAIEAGLKQNFGASGQHFVNVSAFHYNYQDLQVSALLNPAVGGQTFNAGKATIYGLEIESGFKLTRSDSLSATLNLLHARFDKFLGVYDIYGVAVPSGPSGVTTVSDLDPALGIVQPNLAGNTPANSPKVVATLGYDHTFRFGNGSTLKAGLFERYKSSSYTDFYNYHDAQQEAYHQTDVSVEYRSASGHYSVQGYAQNLEDYRPLVNAYYIAAGPDRIFNFWYGQPRVYGLRLGVDY